MQGRLVWLNENGYIDINGNLSNTRTTKFLMPLIGVSEKGLDGYCLNMFINAHIKDKEELMLCIILNKLDFPEQSKEFVILQHLNEHFVKYVEEDEEYVIEYLIPSHFKDDYDKVLKGEYSKTSSPYKQIMTRVHGNNRDETDHLCFVNEVLNPTDAKRELLAKRLFVSKSLISEVSSKPNLSYEIYKTINQLKEETYGEERL